MFEFHYLIIKESDYHTFEAHDNYSLNPLFKLESKNSIDFYFKEPAIFFLEYFEKKNI